MIKFIALMLGVIVCSGCYIPHPSNRVGVRPQQIETWEKVCGVKMKKDKEGIYALKTTKCHWIRTR